MAIVLVSGVVKLGGSTECSKGGSPPGSSPIAGGMANDQRQLALEFAGGKITITRALATYSSAIKEFQRCQQSQAADSLTAPALRCSRRSEIE